MDIKKIAKERIKILINLAFEYAKKDLDLSRKYIELARRIGKKANVRLRKLKRLFCKYCNTPLIFGYTARVRLNKKTKTVNITCLVCNKIKRYPYKPFKLSN
jgi:ribonuclease P protein subunit RPR2